MTHHYSYPGVYIEEQPAAGPIQPVGTSTAAFIGVARAGPINQPTFVTSFDDFRAKFGDRPVDGFYLWYAVRGFFENGGRRAYIVRASSGKRANLPLMDARTQGAQPTLLVTAREVGDPDPKIKVTVTHTSLVDNAHLFRPEADVAQANGDRVQVKNPANEAITAAVLAAQFRPGDSVLISNENKSEKATIREVRGDLLLLTQPLAKSYADAKVRLANLIKGLDRTLRLEGAAGLGPGSVIKICQAKGTGNNQEEISETCVVSQVQAERISPDLVTYRVELENGLANDYNCDPAAAAIQVQSQEFNLTVTRDGREEPYDNLSMARRNARYAPTYVATRQQAEWERRRRLPKEHADYDPDWQALVTVHEPDMPSNAALPERRPKAVAAINMTSGANERPEGPSLEQYQTALNALRDVDDVNFIAIPDSVDIAVQQVLRTHCEDMADRFAIFDPPLTDLEGIEAYVTNLRSERGFAALYYPWIWAPHPDWGKVPVPPSGHVAGVYARADAQRGVHKAPANYSLNGALGVTVDMNNETQGKLNLAGINVLRVFPGQAQPVVWGARTTSDQTAWQYINLRRLLLFVEESIEEGIRWAVFEPNNQGLWEKLRRVITAFLTGVWRAGALFGATAEEAFYVRIDEVINPPAERQLGRLYIEIGLRPVYPAEFIVVRIGLWPGGSEVSEG